MPVCTLRDDLAMHVRSQNRVGYTLVCLNMLGLLDRTAGVPGCESCYAHTGKAVEAVASVLDGFCNAVFTDPVSMARPDGEDLVYYGASLVAREAMAFAAAHPEIPDFTLCLPITLGKTVLGVDFTHSNSLVIRFHWVANRAEWSLYEPNGFNMAWYRNVAAACDRLVEAAVEKIWFDLMTNESMAISAPSGGSSILGLQMRDRAKLADYRNAASEEWITTRVGERKSFIKAKAKIMEHVGEIGGSCSVFSLMMACLCALYPDRSPGDLEADINVLFSLTSGLNAVVDSKRAAWDYRKTVAATREIPKEVLRVMAHGVSSVARVFSLTVANLVPDEDKPSYLCCYNPNKTVGLNALGDSIP